MRKIWFAYIGSLFWVVWGIAATQIGNSLNNIDYSNYSIGGYIGQFIVITGPLWIVFIYDLIKRKIKYKEKKHAIQ